MRATKEIKGPTQVLVRVEIPAEAVSRKIDELFRRASREIQLPGFRPGRVPRAVLEARFGRDFLNEDAQAELIEEYLPQALEQLQIHPVSPPQTKPGEFDPHKDFAFEAEVEVLPEITVQHYTNIEIADVPVEAVQESDIDAVVERLRIDHATLLPKVGDKSAVVEAGDIVELKISGEDEIREWQASPGELTGQLIGRRVGETVLLQAEGQQLRVRIEGVKILEKPDLEELAKTLGHADVAALRAKVRQELEESRARQRERTLKLKILDTIIAQTPIELPLRFIERLVAQELERWHRQGMSEPTAEAVRRLREAIEQRVKRELVLDAIKRQEGLALSDADFERLLEAEAQRREMNPIKFRALLEREGRLQSFRSEVEDERVLQFLYERAKIHPQG
ncbi:MAG: trigger factor [Candidatus Bipolaricaulota bacterium]|nr:trigger factor [Candidatus Bipolaricaulota bacterium]MDW8030868.1 trigger factor [Candidatus Bipolaricaulota bacterium]